MTVIPFYRGDVFSLAGTALLPAGTLTATAQLRTAEGTLISALDVTLTAIDPVPVDPLLPTHNISLEKAASLTGTWALGTALCDVRIADATTLVVHSEKFVVNIMKTITGAPA